MGCGGRSGSRYYGPWPPMNGRDRGYTHYEEGYPTKTPAKSALEILKERFVRGEINKEEFEEMKKELGYGDPAKETTRQSAAPKTQSPSVSHIRGKEASAPRRTGASRPVLLGTATLGILGIIVVILILGASGWLSTLLLLLAIAGLAYIVYTVLRTRNSVPGTHAATSPLETSLGPEWNENAEIEKKLTAGLSGLRMDEGLSTFNNLKEEYDGLEQIYLSDSSIDAALVNTEKMKETIRKVYRNALDLLSRALDISRQVSTIDISKLDRENKDIEEEIKTREAQKLPVLSLKDKKVRNAENMETAKTAYKKVDELFHQVNLCERLLRKARFQIPELANHSPREDFDQMIAELEGRIDLAQKLNEEYDRQGV